MVLDSSGDNCRAWVYFDKDSEFIEMCDSMNILKQVKTEQVYFVYINILIDHHNPVGLEGQRRDNWKVVQQWPNVAWK